MLAFDPSGTAFPCLRFMKHSLKYQIEQPIGDLEKGLDSKDENEWLKELSCITMSSQSPQKCLDCSVSQGCALCTAWNYDCFGTPNKRATFICETHKARVLANYYYWNKLYKELNIDKQFELNMSKEEIIDLLGNERYELLMECGDK